MPYSCQFDDCGLLEMPAECLNLLLFVSKIYVWKTVKQRLKMLQRNFVLKS